jgi:hypothetical protein
VVSGAYLYLRINFKICKVNENIVAGFAHRSEHGLVVKRGGLLEKGNNLKMKIRSFNPSNRVTRGCIFGFSRTPFAGFDDDELTVAVNPAYPFKDEPTGVKIIKHTISAVPRLQLKPLHGFQNQNFWEAGFLGDGRFHTPGFDRNSVSEKEIFPDLFSGGSSVVEDVIKRRFAELRFFGYLGD